MHRHVDAAIGWNRPLTVILITGCRLFGIGKNSWEVWQILHPLRCALCSHFKPVRNRQSQHNDRLELVITTML
jgi:hypothetical protein